MKIALIGASGYVGAKLRDEALQRGHQVVAIVRDPSKLPAHAALTAKTADVYDSAQVAAAVAGSDVVLSAFSSAGEADDVQGKHQRASRSIVAGAKHAGIDRLLMIGGAGSLFVAPGVQLVDTQEFPAEWKPGALGARDALADLQKENELDWAFVSPPPMLVPGERTGKYELGGDSVPPMRDGQPASISTDDLAVAVLDEIEKPKHHRQRFSVFGA
ncbi:MAG TPA: NAD(P)-dependent oxidoreductase [Pseudoxanthomonas sp.]|nr:NAD(P)-dependent oxidoreductase [Pseudoxanthomonas sp.]